MCLAVRLGIIWEPIPNPAFPGFEPGTATMPSEHVGTELTGPFLDPHRSADQDKGTEPLGPPHLYLHSRE